MEGYMKNAAATRSIIFSRLQNFSEHLNRQSLNEMYSIEFLKTSSAASSFIWIRKLTLIRFHKRELIGERPSYVRAENQMAEKYFSLTRVEGFSSWPLIKYDENSYILTVMNCIL